MGENCAEKEGARVGESIVGVGKQEPSLMTYV